MDPVRTPAAGGLGIAQSLRSGLAAGCVAGPLFGLADGLVAANLDAVRASRLALAGCLAGAVLEYTLVAMAALALFGVLLHPVLRRIEGTRRYLFLLRAGIAVGLFAEAYWWTRPYVFYGHAATSPGRLLSTVAMLAVAIVAGTVLGRWIVRAPVRAKRVFVLFAAASWIVGTVFLVLQRNAIGDRGVLNARNRDLPNVLLVIVDAMRRDVLGCYGNTHVQTPHIDRLAKEGVVFEDAFTQAPFTLPSFGSILTGKYPRRHGLMRMKAGVTMPSNRTLPLHLKSATKADGTRLEDADWLEATFHTGTLTAASGLLGGFDMRYEATAGHDLVVLESSWSTFRSGLLLAILPNKMRQHLALGGTAEEAVKWIGEHGDRRFLAMVHLFSTHTPYDPPQEFRRMYCDPAYAGPISAFYADSRRALDAGKYVPTLADVAQIRNLYYAGVSQADAEIGTLVDALEKRGILDDTLVIVTADHGESLGEMSGDARLWEHSHMVQTNLRIPLVLRWPKGLGRGLRGKGLVDEIDILPTVCELLGLRAPGEVPGEEADRIDGKSALPLVRGETDGVRLFSFAEGDFHVSVQDKKFKLVVPRTVVREQKTFVEFAQSSRTRPSGLFDVTEDPDEKFDQFEKQRGQAERLFAILRDWNEKLPIPPDAVIPASPDQIELMNRLGYTQGSQGDDERHEHPK